MRKKSMDYGSSFGDLRIECNPDYPRNDIGVAQLFYDLHSGFIRYVYEEKRGSFIAGGIGSKTRAASVLWNGVKTSRKVIPYMPKPLKMERRKAKSFLNMRQGLRAGNGARVSCPMRVPLTR